MCNRISPAEREIRRRLAAYEDLLTTMIVVATTSNVLPPHIEAQVLESVRKAQAGPEDL